MQLYGALVQVRCPKDLCLFWDLATSLIYKAMKYTSFTFFYFRLKLEAFRTCMDLQKAGHGLQDS